MEKTIRPIEETDPEIGQFFQAVAQGKKPYNIIGVRQWKDDVVLIPGPIKTTKQKRNDPCACGRKKSDGKPYKYKQCCGKNK